MQLMRLFRQPQPSAVSTGVLTPGSALFIPRVQAGVQLLGSKTPGWQGEVNPEKLDIADTFACVLGQVFGTYQAGLRELGLEGGTAALSEFALARSYGFHACFHLVAAAHPGEEPLTRELLALGLSWNRPVRLLTEAWKYRLAA